MRPASALLLTSIMLLLLAPGAAAQRNAAETHIVRPGETLGLIAQAYGVSMDELAAENGIGNAHLIYSWQLLTIPLGPSTEEVPATVNVARPGETPYSIADAYDMNLFEFLVLNRNNRGRLYPGDRLALPLPGDDSAAMPETAPAAGALVHVVKAGESLSKIAEAYGVTLQELQAENGLYSWLIHPGLELRIPAGGKPPAPQSEAALPEEEPAAAPEPEIESAPEPALKASEYVHIVQFGDALGKIAEAYGVSLDDLHTLNELTSMDDPSGAETADTGRRRPASPSKSRPRRQTRRRAQDQPSHKRTRYPCGSARRDSVPDRAEIRPLARYPDDRQRHRGSEPHTLRLDLARAQSGVLHAASGINTSGSHPARGARPRRTAQTICRQTGRDSVADRP